MEPGRGVHPLVQVLLLDVGMAVEMDDADGLRRAFGDAAHGGEADGMVATQDDRHRTAGEDMGAGARDLVEGLLDVRRDGEDVARIAKRHLFPQVHAQFVVVGGVERGDLADALWPEAGAGAVGGAAVERRAQHGGVEMADIGHVLRIGRLQEGVDAGIVGQFTAREGGDGAVLHRFRRRQPHAQRPLPLLLPFLRGQFRLRPRRLPAEQLRQVRMVLSPGLRRALPSRCR